ncbi:MAG: UDP-glucuronate decarboxylase [Alteromonas naphthalenivorans]|jgi:UDP-glucuronate decarboxylase
MNKKIIITGANGFIGRHLIPFFEQEYQLYGFYLEHNTTIEKFPYINWIKVNLKDFMATSHAIKEISPDGLIHLAWNIQDPNYQTSIENFEWVAASLNIIKAFGENKGKRLLIAGSCIEYDWGRTNFSEKCSHLNWQLPYANAKNSLHKMTQCLSSLYSFSYVWTRIFYLYGPHQPSRCLIPSIINNLSQDKKIQCNDSSQFLDYLHVHDVAQGIYKAFISDHNGPINICSSQGTKVKDIALALAEKLNKKTLITLKKDRSLKHSIIGTNTLLTQLNWQQTLSLQKGLNQLINK